MPFGAGTTPPALPISPLKIDPTTNSPKNETKKAKFPRDFGKSEKNPGFSLSPQNLLGVFRMQYIGGRLFFYTTVAGPPLLETGAGQIRPESPRESVERAENCRGWRKNDLTRVPVGGTLEASRKSGCQVQNQPEKCSKLEAKIREKINKPR